MLAIPSSKYLGRKFTLGWASLFLILSVIGSAASPTFYYFVLFRILGGIGVGLVASTSPMYISEISPKNYRGRLSMVNDFSIVLGQILIFFINYLIAKDMSQEWLQAVGWRWMLGSEIAPCILFAWLLLYIPESPRFYYSIGLKHEAIRIATTLYSSKEVAEMITSFETRKTAKRLSFGVLAIACCLAMFQQLSGVNIMMYYAPVILEKITGSYEEALFQTIWIGVAQLVGVFAGGYLLDKFGRVPMMKIGALGSAAGLLFISYTLYHNANPYLSLAGMIVFMLFYAVSFGLGMWVLIAEVFPNHSRSVGLPLAVTFNWIANFAVAQTFPSINEEFGGSYAMIGYAICCIIGYLFVSYFLKETKGKSLEEISY